MAALNYAGIQAANYNNITGRRARYALIPATTGVPGVGVILTCGAGAWGVQADLVAAKGIVTDFWICGLCLDTTDAAAVYEIQISDGVPTVLAEARLDLSAVTVAMGLVPVGQYPIYMVANAQVQGRLGGAGGKVLGVSLLYATGLE